MERVDTEIKLLMRPYSPFDENEITVDSLLYNDLKLSTFDLSCLIRDIEDHFSIMITTEEETILMEDNYGELVSLVITKLYKS